MVKGIKVRGLRHKYISGTKQAVLALKGLDIDINPNETLAIIGENGSGKTTFVKHLNGLLKATEGSIEVNGLLVLDIPVDQMAKTVGLVFQNPDDQLFNSSVRNEIHFGPQNIGMNPHKMLEMESYAANIAGLTEVLDVHPYDLPYSTRKILAIASVLAMDPDYVILDEPTTGQDFQGIMLISNIIRSLKERGKTVITITHDMDFVAECFQRTIVLCQGEKLLDGPTEEVLARTEELIKSKVRPPHLTLLAQKINFDRPVYSIESFYAEIRKRLKEERGI